jgi:hypothetical protein
MRQLRHPGLFASYRGWPNPALFSYAVLTILVYHGNKRVFFVHWSTD